MLRAEQQHEAGTGAERLGEVLDEIDAPLDDANIGRFVEMLRSMQQHTQFILITHNRKTMEIADRLYGVTMEEPGVSKLISVQLN